MHIYIYIYIMFCLFVDWTKAVDRSMFSMSKACFNEWKLVPGLLHKEHVYICTKDR